MNSITTDNIPLLLDTVTGYYKTPSLWAALGTDQLYQTFLDVSYVWYPKNQQRISDDIALVPGWQVSATRIRMLKSSTYVFRKDSFSLYICFNPFHSGRPKLYGVLAVLSAIGLRRLSFIIRTSCNSKLCIPRSDGSLIRI